MNRPLLETVRGLIERTYAIDSGLGELGPFVIGDRGLRRLFRRDRIVRAIGSTGGTGAQTLVRETDEGVAACIYFPDEMIRRLEAAPPQCGLGEHNVEAFAAFVEEIDHLLVIAERALRRRPVSLFELELHANVTKYLVLARFLAGQAGGLEPAARIWLRHELFERARYCDEDAGVRTRYRDAAAWAVRLIDRIAALAPGATVAALRRFHAEGVGAKLRLIDALAAGRAGRA